MRLLTLFFLTFLQFSAVAAAENAEEVVSTIPNVTSQDLAGTPWEKIRVPPGTQLIVTKDPKGVEKRTLKFSGGVTMSEIEGGGTLASDNSGKGAVWCAWEIAVEIINELEICASDDKEFGKNIDLAIDRINDFIVVNNLTPITKIEIEDRIKRKLSKLQQGVSKKSKEDLRKWCGTNMASHAKSTPSEKFKSDMDELLSIPRPPVMNPCL